MRYVTSLENYLTRLPEMIVDAQVRLAELPTGRGWEIQRDINNAQRGISQLEQELETHIPQAIITFTNRANNWVEKDLIEYDLDVEEQEAKDARQAIKDEKAAAKAAKLVLKEERQAKIDANAKKKFIELVQTNNFYQMFWKDEAVGEEWEAKFENAREFQDDINARQKAFYEAQPLELNGEENKYPNYSHEVIYGRLYIVTRNKPEGKGRKLNSSKC